MISREKLSSLSLWDLALIEWRTRWLKRARRKQVVDFSQIAQDTIFYHCGRGFGKTELLCQWLCYELCSHPGSYGHLIAPTHNDIRYVDLEGPSGVLSIVPDVLIKHYNKTDAIIEFYNGSILRGFSSEEPERLRGPQCTYLACDEIAAWQKDRETFEQSKFGHRLGQRTLCVVTSTPKPKELIRELFADKTIRKIGGTMEENKDNLSPNFIKQMNQLKGTRLGRQELAGELLDQEELGVIRRSQWKKYPAGAPWPDFEIVVMSLDTAMSEDSVDVKKNRTDFTACTVWGGWREETRQVKYADDGSEQMKREPKIMLLDAWQERLGFPDLVARVKQEKEKQYGAGRMSPKVVPIYGPKLAWGVGRKVDLILIEDINSGKSLRQQLRREGVPVVPYNPGKADKLLRLNIVSAAFTAGYVWAQGHEIKTNEFNAIAEPVIAQMCSYAGEDSLEHDDLMDSSTQALIWLMRNWLQIQTYQPYTPHRRTTWANPYAS